jgi:hypothetical protein
LTGLDTIRAIFVLETGVMLTYALFIATNPEPVSNSDWTHVDQVFDRARLSSGGTVVQVRSSEAPDPGEDDFDHHVATFVNGLHLEMRDDGPDTFSYLADGQVIGTASLDDGQWLLSRATGEADVGVADEVATMPADEHPRHDVQARFGKIVEDWLS